MSKNVDEMLVVKFGLWKDEIIKLRYEVWANEGGLAASYNSATAWIDEHDWHAEHLIYIRNNQLVGAVRYCKHDRIAHLPDHRLFVLAGIRQSQRKVFSINRLVVKPELQKNVGIGYRLSVEVLQLIERRGERGEILIVGPKHTQRMATTLGFSLVGKALPVPYLTKAITCRTMRKILSPKKCCDLIVPLAPSRASRAPLRGGSFRIRGYHSRIVRRA